MSKRKNVLAILAFSAPLALMAPLADASDTPRQVADSGKVEANGLKMAARSNQGADATSLNAQAHGQATANGPAYGHRTNMQSWQQRPRLRQLR